MVAPGLCCDGTAWPRLTHGREASGRNACFHTRNTGQKHHLVLSFFWKKRDVFGDDMLTIKFTGEKVKNKL